MNRSSTTRLASPIARASSAATGRPVKICLTREEVFYCHRGRHPTLMKVKTGVKKDGAITALHFQTLLDGGGYGSYGVASTYYTGALQATDSFPQSSYVRWTTQQYVNGYYLASQRVYKIIPASGDTPNKHDILTGANKISMDKMPEGVRVFPETLARYSRRKTK